MAEQNMLNDKNSGDSSYLDSDNEDGSENNEEVVEKRAESKKRGTVIKPKRSLSTVNTNRIEDDEDENNIDDVKFQELSYEDVQINLRLLGDLKEGEKLMISGDRYVVVDQRYIQGIRRYLTSDSRIRSLDFISHVIIETKRYCEEAVKNINQNDYKQINLEKLINIQTLLTGALTGLGRMATTYNDDKLSRAKIETIATTVKTFCDRDLKSAIDSDKVHDKKSN